MPPFCCPINDRLGVGHNIDCHKHPNRGAHWLNYPDGIGDVRFHFRDGSSHVLRRVQHESIGGDPNGNRSDTVGEFENGNVFHVPNVVWWEVVYEN